jgi:restriction system protein
MLLNLQSLFQADQFPPTFPAVVLPALLTLGDKSTEGALVEAVAIPWFEIVKLFERDPVAAYRIDDRTWEEIIAGAYRVAGFDEVILTPRSGDKGRDVIATKTGLGSIRIFDQVKAYQPEHVVTANDVRAMLGVITGAQNVGGEKGFLCHKNPLNASRKSVNSPSKPPMPGNLVCET